MLPGNECCASRSKARRLDGLDRDAARAKTSDGAVHEQRQVVQAGAQRRDLDDEDGQPEEQVLPHRAVVHGAERPVAGRDDARVDLAALETANRPDLAVLKDSQQLGLRFGGQVPNLIEEEGAAMRGHEEAGVIGVRARKGAPAVSEQLALEEIAGQRGAVDGHERPAGAPAVRVDGTGDEFLARPGLADNENGRVVSRGSEGTLEHRPHARRPAQNPIEAEACRRPGGAVPRGCRASPPPRGCVPPPCEGPRPHTGWAGSLLRHGASPRWPPPRLAVRAARARARRAVAPERRRAVRDPSPQSEPG